MPKKVEITEKQKQQFNTMLNLLKKIKAYQSPEKLRKHSQLLPAKAWELVPYAQLRVETIG